MQSEYYTLADRELIRTRIDYANAMLRGRGTVPLRVLILSILVGRPSSISPLLSADMQRRVRKETAREDFDAAIATVLHDAVLEDAAPMSPMRDSVPAIACPLMKPPSLAAKGAHERGTAALNAALLSADKDEERSVQIRPERAAAEPGCTRSVGRGVYAQTDGFSVWYAEAMFSDDAKGGATDFGAIGMNVDSIVASVLMHELGHVLHVDPATKPLFDRLERAYWQAAALVTRKERKERIIEASHADMLEFVASTFAEDNLRLKRTVLDE